MALITDYGTLKAAIGTYSHRAGSMEVEDAYPIFVQTATTLINRRLRCREMEVSATISSSTGVFALPADFLELRDVKNGGEPVFLMSPQQNDTLMRHSNKRYWITGSNLHYRAYGEVPSGNVDLDIIYYASLDNLILDTDTNAVLLRNPNLYLYGSMYKYAIFSEEDDATVAKWLAMFTSEVDEINREAKKAQYSGAPARIGSY